MLGKKIKQYLNEKGLKQSYLSAKCGFPQPILSAMLNGERKITAEEYMNICHALDVDLSMFDDNQEAS